MYSDDDLFPNFSPTRGPVNIERIPVSSILRASLKEVGASDSEINCFELVPIENRVYCAECIRRWYSHGDSIILFFAAVLISPCRPGDCRKVGSDRIPRIAWERFPTYPVDNSFAPFDLRAVYHSRPDLRYRIDLSRSDGDSSKVKSESLFAAGWVPQQAN